MMKTTWKRQVLLILSGAVIGALLVGTAIAVTSNNFRYAETKTGYLGLSHMDFIAQDTGTDFIHYQQDGITSDAECFATGVNLPQGARAKTVTYFYKSPAGDDFYGDFTRTKAKSVGAAEYPPFTDMGPRAEPVDDSDQPAAVTTSVNDSKELINNREFEYAVMACPAGGYFLGARIKYTYTTAGD